MDRKLFSVVTLALLATPLSELGWGSDPVTEGVVTRVAAEALVPSSFMIQPESQLWLEGGSTVRSYKCAATEIIGQVRTSGDGELPPLGQLVDAVEEAGITIPVEELDCDNGTMNGHMLKALNSKSHKTIEYELTGFEIVDGGDTAGKIEMKGRLTINGTELAKTIPAEIELAGDGTIRLKGQTELDMTEFGVKPPRLMLGTLKVHDDVTIHFDVIFRP